ncbi:MAG: hypothetical protein JSW25_00430 [Thermoplasmata archaeon]|nr:MAG: hypothetical protein JSW25_00430 [Thermoplasmata archaeon]
MKKMALIVSLFLIVSAASATAWGPNDPSDKMADPDGDNLGNLDEFRAGSNPLVPDTDGGGIPDGWEVKYGLDPTNPDDDTYDMDGDGWDNLKEWQVGTHPLKANTDDDSYPIDSTDPDPLHPDGDMYVDPPPPLPTPDIPLPDRDEDMLPDIHEPLYGCDPDVADADKDGLLDGYEVAVVCDPHDPDTDDDGLLDGQECMKDNFDWCYTGTNPRRADTDGDGISDYYDDLDMDGLANFEEWIYIEGQLPLGWTDPKDRDSDDDTVTDGREVKGNPLNGWQTSNPNMADTDHDNLRDDIDPRTWEPDYLAWSRIRSNNVFQSSFVPPIVTKGVPFNIEGHVEFNQTEFTGGDTGDWMPIETSMKVQVWLEQGDVFVPISDVVVTGNDGKFKVSCTLGDDIRAGEAVLKITTSIHEKVDYIPVTWTDLDGNLIDI